MSLSAVQKTLAGVGALFIAIVFNLHAQLLLAFTGLVIVDLISKWIALSRQYLIKSRRRKTQNGPRRMMRELRVSAGL